MKKILLIVCFCLAGVSIFAQAKKKTTAKKPVKKAVSPTSRANAAGIDTAIKTPVVVAPVKPIVPAKPFERPVDGYFVKNNILSAKVTPYATLREVDVAMSKRIWREIDLREKMNTYMASPKARLIDVFMKAIADGELTAFDATANAEKDDSNGDSFSTPLSPADAMKKMVDSAVVDKFDTKGDKIGSTVVAGTFAPDSIIKFRIKEDWIFDKQRSVWEPRIIGIAPMVKLKVPGADLALDYQPAFWIYFPAARPILVTKEVFSGKNDATGLSYDDIFLKRMFTSYIVKESNAQDLRIKDYADGIDRLYESERVKKTLMDWELNLWSY
jgi:gliding motility associated protien GldN